MLGPLCAHSSGPRIGPEGEGSRGGNCINEFLIKAKLSTDTGERGHFSFLSSSSDIADFSYWFIQHCQLLQLYGESFSKDLALGVICLMK